MRYLITAGPTREALDDVRYLSNHSSGKLGFALARAAARRGHHVTLIHGPVCLRRPAGVQEMVPVVSAVDLYRESRARAAGYDVAIMVAAVADYTPRHPVRGKMKKSAPSLTLELRRTRDVAASLGRLKRPGQLLVGFALEADDPDNREALRKLRQKRCNLIVANRPATLGSDRARLLVLDRQGLRLELAGRKGQVARRLVEFLDGYRP